MNHPIDNIPHKRLVDSLLLGKYTLEKVNDYLSQYNFPPVSEEHYRLIYNRLKTAFPDHFSSPTAFSNEAIEYSGVRDMYSYLFDKKFFIADSPPIEAFDEALKAWQNPMVTRALKAMAFAQISEEEIELYANAKYGQGYNSEVYMIFFKYFFDPFDWTYQIRKEYWEKETDKDLKRLYKLGLTESPDFIVWKLGLAPTRTFGDMLEDMTRDCYYNFKEKRDINSDEANKWGQLMLKAMDKLKEVEPSGTGKTSYSEDFHLQLKTTTTTEVIKSSGELQVEVPEFKVSVDGSVASFEDITKLVNDEEE